MDDQWRKQKLLGNRRRELTNWTVQNPKLTYIGGSKFDAWNGSLANQALSSGWYGNNPDADRTHKLQSASLSFLAGVEPKDELEGMLAAQLLASHNAAMECYRRAMISEQSFEGRKENLSQANKLSRTHATLLEALNRHRGKGQQKVTVEHVHVHEGGQAIVGNVEGGWDTRINPMHLDNPEKIHRHGSGQGCRYCGSPSFGTACTNSPSKVHNPLTGFENLINFSGRNIRLQQCIPIDLWSWKWAVEVSFWHRKHPWLKRANANMDVVLEEVCSDLPHGGDHETRKHIAQRLMQAAKKGNVTLEGLRTVASRALSELSSRKSA
jgi:hypothetical protein